VDVRGRSGAHRLGASTRRVPRAIVAATLFAGAALQPACAREAPAGSRALYELERLVFVSPAECFLVPNTDLSLRAPILFDRFELTRADLRAYWPDRRRRADLLPWSTDAALDSPERADWPAYLDFGEAQELAAQRNMRVPKPHEWLHVAVGRRDFLSPWGGREFFANTVVQQDGKDFSLGSPCRVGSYENGKSRPFGCYDLLGNVWEWVDGVVLGCDPPPIAGAAFDERDDAAGTMTSILGGAFDTRWRPTFEFDRTVNQQRFHARRVDKRTLSPSIGVRMCADAPQYLWTAAPRWGTDAHAHARVREVGARWASDDSARHSLRALLAELRARPAAPVQLGWLEEGLQGGP